MAGGEDSGLVMATCDPLSGEQQWHYHSSTGVIQSAEVQL